MATNLPSLDLGCDKESAFETALDNIAKELTNEEIKTLKDESLNIAQSEWDEIDNGAKFVDTLKSNCFVTKDNVNELIELLSGRRLNRAALILENYKKGYVLPTMEVEKCVLHEDCVISKYCESCNKAICAECVCESHTECKYFHIKDTENKINSVRKDICKILKSAEEECTTLEGECLKQRRNQSESREHAQKQIVDMAARLTDRIENETKGFLSLIENSESIIRDAVFKLMNFSEEMKDLNKEMQNITGSQLTDWWKVKQILRKATESSEVCQKLKERNVDMFCNIVPNDGTFCELMFCTLVGGVTLDYNQMVHIYDGRLSNGNVMLVCFDGKDPSKEYWKHPVKVGDHHAPVVMSYLSLKWQDSSRLLFAVGRKVFIVQLRCAKDLYDSVEYVSVMMIDDVPDTSWITNITAHYPKNGDIRDEFFVSIHKSNTLREYRICGRTLRHIDVPMYLISNGIACFSYCYNTFAIIAHGSDSVIFVLADGTVRKVRSLGPPSAGMMPIIVIWTGATWLVLYISHDGNEWKVLSCSMTGKLVMECDEGVSCKDNNVPVSLTRLRSDGFVSFKNNTVRNFKY